MASQPIQRADLTRAVDLAIAGDWDGAHKIVQEDEDDATSCWIHAVLHKIEGDIGNSRYWYRRAGQSYEAYPDTKAELSAIKAALTYSQRSLRDRTRAPSSLAPGYLARLG